MKLVKNSRKNMKLTNNIPGGSPSAGGKFSGGKSMVVYGIANIIFYKCDFFLRRHHFSYPQKL